MLIESIAHIISKKLNRPTLEEATHYVQEYSALD